MAEQERPAEVPLNDEPVEVPKRDQTPKEPPITFREFDVRKFTSFKLSANLSLDTQNIFCIKTIFISEGRQMYCTCKEFLLV